MKVINKKSFGSFLSFIRVIHVRVAVLTCMLFMLSACDLESSTEIETSSDNLTTREILELPDHMPTPYVPDFNPLTNAKIQLGRFLFYETMLSANQAQSCASCHDQSLAFSDGVAQPLGSTGHQLVRNSQSLVNVIYYSTLTWSNDTFLELEDQLNVPIRADNPVELGVTDDELEEVLQRFEDDHEYLAMFTTAFPDSDSSVTMNKIIFSLASFVRTMISASSPYDKYLAGDKTALTAQEIEGYQLFNGEKFECFHCHSGINFSSSYRDANKATDAIEFPFFNNGLYNVGGDGSYPEEDQGLYDLSLDPADKGLFRPQSLRNIELTAPYMHDGSIATLREVIEHYARGGTLTGSGVNAGDGKNSPLKSVLIPGFDATDEEIDAVIAFLEALTDEEFITSSKFSNPFEE
ncbi:MbnH family di-heme enzyme [uncultured Psychrosphaera sp.]|uniref:MbnH family di-heme enzyme n=1 Tax=uncultured Psychrosphaera sp. TaxID=1403522 RepID=UPI002620E03E|nr:MbnH family di-heme enzyme [uncultured Psychrosphaera sp.]